MRRALAGFRRNVRSLAESCAEPLPRLRGRLGRGNFRRDSDAPQLCPRLPPPRPSPAGGEGGKPCALGLCLAAFLWAGSAPAQTLRIGLQDDPDLLDPARSGTFVGRVVFAALCDKLVDIDRELNIVPLLATEW